jgi:hypothetical protein
MFGNMIKSLKKPTATPKYRTAKMSSGLVRVAHKISSNINEPQIVKIGDKYFRVKELG